MKKIIVFIFLHLCIFSSIAQINTDRVIAIGRNALYFEDYILSIQYFNQVIKAKPWLDMPYFYRAVAKLNLDDYVGAEEDCNLALQQNPFMVRAYYARGIARQSQGKYDLAIEDYKKGLEFWPKDRPMMTNRAIAYIQKKEYEKAKEFFNEIIEAFPKEANSYMARGSLNAETGDTISALADYNKAIEIDPYYAPAYGNRALILYQDNKMNDALTDLNEAIRLSPRDEGFYINRGLVRYNLNDLRGAMSDYDQVIALNGNNLIARFNRGLLRFQVGDNNRAIEDFDVVIAQEPDNHMAYYNRALLLSAIGEYETAIKDYDIILEQFPNFLPGYYNRSEAKRNINDITGAEKDYWFAQELERTHGRAKLPTAQTGSVKQQDNQDTETDTETEDDDNEKKETREQSDKNINKFNSLVVHNKNEEQKSKYDSEIRGNVQDKNIDIDLENQFILTYYEKIDKVKESVNYNKTIESFNERTVLGWNLLITNQEASLNEFQIDAHFTSIDEYSEKIEKDDKNADYYFGRGIDFMLVQDFSEAINSLVKAINIDPTYTLAYFNRAVVLYKQIDYEQSISSHDELSDAMRIQFGSTNNALSTSPVSKERDNMSFAYEQILRDYNTVIQQDPSFTFAYFNRGYIRCMQRDYRAAILDFNEAIRRNPEFAEAYFNRGLIRLLSQGDTQRGIADLSKAGELGIVKAYNIIKRMTK